MKVLLLGGGGREHALAWAMAGSPQVTELLMVPGNPGMAELGSVVEGIDPTEAGAVAAMAKTAGVGLVVVGPEAPLAAGVVDALTAVGIPSFGPTRAAARLETSKSFAKEVMARARVPTAAARVFSSENEAFAHLARSTGPYVVKADGLAAGKGVLVTTDRDEARRWVTRCLEGGFGEAGRSVLVEEHLEGPEVSVFALCAGTEVAPLEPARDYKRLEEGDRGPNTGGMGAYSPVPDLPADLVEVAVEGVIRPVLAQMQGLGHPYSGFLYAGLVLTAAGPKVLEFNCRLGDPEAQTVLPRLGDDLVELIGSALDGGLEDRPVSWADTAAVDVVLASPGYPDHPETGAPISGLPQAAAVPGVQLFHAGTRRRGTGLVTAGGRVLNVVGTGASLEEARRRAYDAAGRIEWPGMQYRRDIAGGS